ncbi:hypothetical protein [Oceaniferula spumae]
MHPPHLIKSRTIKWLNGVILQSNRILSAPTDESANRIGCDAHFFAISLGSLLYWLSKTDLASVSYSAEIKDIQNQLAEGKNIRDMLEHDGDYIIGRGRNQGDYEITTKVNNGFTEIKGLAPFTLLRTNEGVSLGGRISIELSLNLATKLLQKMS